MYADNKEEKPTLVEEPAVAYGYGVRSGRNYTYADYLTWIDGKRREIIDGVVRLFSAPKTNHALISEKITFELGNYIRKNKGKCKVFHAPFDVRLPKNNEVANDKIYTVVQPDICVVCDLSRLDQRGCLGAPDLVVEIQSVSTARYDLTEKFSAYESAGVREYWIVFPGMCGITIFTLQGNGKYDKGTVYELEGFVRSNVLPGLDMNITELFEDLI